MDRIYSFRIEFTLFRIEFTLFQIQKYSVEFTVFQYIFLVSHVGFGTACPGTFVEFADSSISVDFLLSVVTQLSIYFFHTIYLFLYLISGNIFIYFFIYLLNSYLTFFDVLFSVHILKFMLNKFHTFNGRSFTSNKYRLTHLMCAIQSQQHQQIPCTK